MPKFVFDDRYHLLIVKERRTAFDEFVASRAEAEMKEKKLKAKEKKEKFLKFLQESKITTKLVCGRVLGVAFKLIVGRPLMSFYVSTVETKSSKL